MNPTPAMRQRAVRGDKGGRVVSESARGPEELPDHDHKPKLANPTGKRSTGGPISWYSWLDVVIVLVFVALAAFTRFVNISDPPSLVFDEEHFTKFSTWYVSGHYFVDIHPPLAKLAFAWMLWMLGFKGAQEMNVPWWTDKGFVGTTDWKLLYDPAYGELFLPLRQFSATMGTILVPVAYLSARAVGCHPLSAIVMGWMVLTETVITLQSRLILCDVFLYLFNIASIGASFAATNPRLSLRTQYLASIGVGILLGCAMSVKLTALGTVAVVGIHQALTLLTEMAATRPHVSVAPLAWKGLIKATLLLSAATVVFFGLWIVHIELLPYSGQGDGFSVPEFQRTLIEKTLPGSERSNVSDPNSCPNVANAWSDCGFAGITPQQCADRGCCWDPKSPRAWCYHRGALERPSMGMVAKIREVIRASIANNHGGAVMDHPFMSEWREWPLLTGKSVPFASSRRGGPIKAIGNPGVWWPVATLFAGSLALGALWLLLHSASLLAGFDAWVRARINAGVPVSGGKRTAPASRGKAQPRPPAPSPGATAESLVPEDAEATEEADSGRPVPFWIGFVTLWLGYLLNLVPYELITRSKFIYHGVPALMVGMMLAALSSEYALTWASHGGSSSPLRKLAAYTLYVCLLAAAAFGFYYWGVPYTYGYPLSYEEQRARQWHPKW